MAKEPFSSMVPAANMVTGGRFPPTGVRVPVVKFSVMENSITCGGKPLRIAIFYGSGAVLGVDSSGGGVYESSVAKILLQLRDDFGVEIINFVPAKALRGRKPNRTLHGDPVHGYQRTMAEKILSVTSNPALAAIVEKLSSLKLSKMLHRKGVHAVYLASPNGVASNLGDIPYVTTVWDVGHRDLPGFPEVWSRSQWLSRERNYETVVPRASFIMVDSLVTGRKLEKYYGLHSGRWRSIGLLPNVVVPDNPLREVSSPYIIYPAMKWPHKNHVTLLKALALILKKRPELKLVLTGADQGNGGWIDQTVRDLEIQHSVVDLGFVPRHRVIDLIFHAEVLVMPSLLGPTNLPPLEALALGTKVIVSDVHDFGLEELDGLTKVSGLDVKGWVSAIEETLAQDKSPVPALMPDKHALDTYVEVFSRIALERECWQPG